MQPSKVIILYKTLRYFQKYWESLFDNSRVVNNTLDSSIRVAKRLFKLIPETGRKLDTLVKPKLPNRVRHGRPAFNFGVLMLFFTHTDNGTFHLESTIYYNIIYSLFVILTMMDGNNAQ